MTLWTIAKEIAGLIYSMFVPVLFALWLYSVTHNLNYAVWAYILLCYLEPKRG